VRLRRTNNTLESFWVAAARLANYFLLPGASDGTSSTKSYFSFTLQVLRSTDSSFSALKFKMGGKMNKKIVTMLSLLVGLGLLVSLSGCFIIDLFRAPGEDIYGPANNNNNPAAQPNPQPYPPAGEQQPGLGQGAAPPDQANPAPQTDPQPQADPDPEGPPVPTEQHAWFEETDCAVPDVSGLDASYGPSKLDCHYKWAGDLIKDNGVRIEIEEIFDPAELSQKFSEGFDLAHGQADSHSSNETLSVIRNDDNGFFFMTTFEGGFFPDPAVKEPLCARGNGYELVNERFLVHLVVSVCDYADPTNMGFVRLAESVEDTALAAVERAAAEE
jgi:hypothetical protein